MIVTSPVFANNSPVPEPHTCKGDNISPPLVFDAVPENAKSLVLLVEDIDADPVPWVHWLVFNIPPDIKGAGAGIVPDDSTEGHANGGTPGYEGPCPRYFNDIHHYHFRLLALDTTLDLPASADKTQVVPAMEGHIISEALLVGLCNGEAENK